jgi:hypothetical protein
LGESFGDVKINFQKIACRILGSMGPNIPIFTDSKRGSCRKMDLGAGHVEFGGKRRPNTWIFAYFFLVFFTFFKSLVKIFFGGDDLSHCRPRDKACQKMGQKWKNRFRNVASAVASI